MNTQEWKGKFRRLWFNSHHNEDSYVELEIFAESLIERGRLQGIEEARMCVPEGRTSTSFDDNLKWHGAFSYNEARLETLENIDKLKRE